jgi:signal transduction histidine kinase
MMQDMTGAAVLIVDDDPNVLHTLYAILTFQMKGVTVHLAESGQAALDLIAASDYDAVVSDIKMPGMDGLALLEKIRTIRPGTPVLLITGYDERELLLGALRGGAYDFLQKPIPPGYLVASVSRAIQMRRQARTIAEQETALERHADELECRVRARTRALLDEITWRKQAEEGLRQSEQQLRQLLEDRERISRDLHDNIIQTLYAIGLGLEECQRLCKEDPATAVRKVGNAIRDLNVVIRDVRSYIAWTEPQVSSGRQLRKAIARLVQTMEGAHLIHFRLQVDPRAADQLTAEEANHVLSIAREALSNSLRHSQAKAGTVSLQVQDGYVRFEVMDDGVGFDVNASAGRAQGQGQGLHNIAARAQKLDGKLEVISRPGRGTRIVLVIPKERRHEHA